MSSEEEPTTPDDDLDSWERLLSEQTVLFQRTSLRNKELRARVEEVERELSVWKAALKAADDEKKSLNRNVQRLERNLGSLKDNNPLILCLIDGDGNIFASDLINLGQVGGHQAASILTKGLTDHLADVDSSSRGQIWSTVYCNKTGLLETLIANGLCTAEQFEAFILGFNQASPLFSFVDVGSGKERADEKIKECLRVFTRFPQITKVFFGGAHDNGYISTLNHLQNEGHLQKIIFLRGYKELAFELKNLSLPKLDIDGLFLRRRLQTIPKASNSKILTNKKLSAPIIQAEDFEKFRTKNTLYSVPSTTQSNSSAEKSLRQLEPNVPLHRQKPPPCNFFYLADCKHGSKCRYGHNYDLPSRHIEDLRESSLKWPCPYINRGSLCPYGETCCMGHACPKGRNCSFMKLGKCKFSGSHMHDYTSVRIKSHSTGRSSASSPSDSSPAGQSYSSALPSSPLSSPTSLGGYNFSMGNDGRPLFTVSENIGTRALLARIGRRVDEAVKHDNE